MQRDKKKPNKRTLFDRYSLNLAFYKPDLRGYFMCPLCLRVFSEDALHSKLLTEEHIFPRAVRGGYNLITITCKRCNSVSGSQLEKYLAEYFKILSFRNMEEGQRTRIRLTTGEGEIGGDVEFRGRIVLLYDNEGVSNPKKQDKFYNYLQSMVGKTGWKLRIQKRFDYKHNRYRAAILRVAYLIMFYYFGYEYILNPNLELVRRQIAEPDKKSLPEWFIIRWLEDFSLPNLGKPTVSIVIRPQKLRSFLVTFVLKGKQPQSYGIIMPGPASGDDGVYRKYAETEEINIEYNYLLPRWDALTNKSAIGWMGRLWDVITGNMPRVKLKGQQDFLLE